ncbi:MAG: class I SAM-dependent methyltransferase, partial [Nanoarchaeota archaeon]|nr:class I SAM-dependent methyltransferase [Nanoarchaeota archaeon]
MKCIICKNEKFQKLRFIKEHSKYSGRKYDLLKCKKCGLIRPNPLPYTNEDKNTIYNDSKNIKFYNSKTGKIEEDSFEYKYYFKHFRPFAKLIDKYNIQGKVLDVGCGAGHLMEVLLKKGLQVEGIEITSKLVKALSNNFKVYNAEIDSKKLKKESYNLITANQVLEHIENPRLFIAAVKKILKKEGYFIFSVPYL